MVRLAAPPKALLTLSELMFVRSMLTPPIGAGALILLPPSGDLC